MKTAFRAAFGTALALFVIVAGAVSLSLGKIVKTAVETAGPRVLGAPVSVESATISPLSGRGVLRGLVIGNPAGYESASAVSVGSVEIEVKLSSLLTDTIVVERVAVSAPELTWEIGPGGSNLARLQRNAEESAVRYGGEGSQGPRSPVAPEKKGKALLIEDFKVAGGKVCLAATAFGGQTLTASLPDVHLSNLGGPGRSPAEAAAQVLGAVANSAAGAVAQIGAHSLGTALSALGAIFNRGGK
jgi:hypothetical protein